MLYYQKYILLKKITSADPSDLLTSNMAAQLSSWPIRIYFPTPGDAKRDATVAYRAIITSK